MRTLRAAATGPSRAIRSPYCSSDSAIGLVDGWSGIALALDTAATVLGDEALREAASAAFRKDLDATVLAPDGSRQVLDGSRLMPYLAEGSAGVLWAILTSSAALRAQFSARTLTELARATEVRCTANGGLFMGRAGLRVARHAAATHGLDCEPVTPEVFIDELAAYCFVVQDAHGTLVGGQGGLRLSADFSSGNAGVVRAIDAVTGGSAGWDLFPGLGALEDLRSDARDTDPRRPRT